MDRSPPITRLVMVGACYIDTILSVPSFPQEDEKLRASSLGKRRGGNVANTLEVLQQLFSSPFKNNNNQNVVDLNLLCVLPSSTSLATKFVKESFGPTVNLSLCLHRENHTEAASSFVIKATSTASRTIVNYNNLPEMTLEEFQFQTKESPDKRSRRTWYHFEGRIPETSVACMRWLRQEYPDVVISAEVEKPGREGLEEMAAEADVVFYAKGWAVAKGFHDVGQFLQAQAGMLKGANLLCCTWGGEGAAVIRPKDGLYHHEPPYVNKEKLVVDTIGAGDTFIAGVLYRLLTSDEADIKGALQFANKLAGRKVLQDGFAGLA